MRVLAIDPGDVQSAYVVTAGDLRPVACGKVENMALRDLLRNHDTRRSWDYDVAAVEMIASYGMPVGVTVFETCLWIGRYVETITRLGMTPRLVYRKDVKLSICGTSQAKDPNIRRALIDRFAPGERNDGKGTKAEPGWFHGFHSDIWQAYAVAVAVADTTPQTAIIETAGTTRQEGITDDAVSELHRPPYLRPGVHDRAASPVAVPRGVGRDGETPARGGREAAGRVPGHRVRCR